ncbi:platelet binding protein GspB isoform X1 [Bactrocera oleae]|uniref:platelet binding protein GspB isoform X1 n=1 Tax=Bactrocera oleae TaxID=104688 RepID=UPI00387EB06C
MNDVGAIFLVIIVFGVIYLIIRVCAIMCCGPVKENNSNERGVRRRVIRRIRIEPANVAESGGRTTTTSTVTGASTSAATEDRQGNIFTIANESANNPLPHRCTDFFYVEPSAEDAARIRAQLEKDEKDLPTYEEVMAMSAAQAAAGTLSPPPTTSTTSVATTDTTVPPYSEVDRNGTHAAPLTLEIGTTAWPTGNETAPAAVAGAASTSRAAAAAATNTATTATVVTIANSVSNTSV